MPSPGTTAIRCVRAMDTAPRQPAVPDAAPPPPSIGRADRPATRFPECPGGPHRHHDGGVDTVGCLITEGGLFDRDEPAILDHGQEGGGRGVVLLRPE